MSTSVAIAAGGTGGHLVPGLAIAAALRTEEPDARITFVGTARGMESTLIPDAGYPLEVTGVRPFSASARGAVGVASVVPAVRAARRILRRVQARVVIGMGGYASLPVVIAARTAGIPALIHEANAVAGLANQAAARFTANIALAFPAAAAGFGGRGVVTGMPLRPGFASFDGDALRAEAHEFFGLDPARRTVLVLGGSLGAVRLNRAAAGLARAWDGRADVQVLVAHGRGNEAPFAGLVAPGCVALPFIERMDLAYAAADLIVARAGGSTVAEVAAVGRASILVPYPHARRREQDANAAFLADAGAAIVLADADVTPERLQVEVERLLGDDETRARMAAAAAALGRTDAAATIAAWALRLSEGAA